MSAVEERNTSESPGSTYPHVTQILKDKNASDMNGHARQRLGTTSTDPERQVVARVETDVFGNEDGAEIHYKTCEWWHTGIRTNFYPYLLYDAKPTSSYAC